MVLGYLDACFKYLELVFTQNLSLFPSLHNAIMDF